MGAVQSELWGDNSGFSTTAAMVCLPLPGAQQADGALDEQARILGRRFDQRRRHS